MSEKKEPRLSGDTKKESIMNFLIVASERGKFILKNLLTTIKITEEKKFIINYKLSIYLEISIDR